jgi:peptide/nickel transport system substrate-binding protein
MSMTTVATTEMLFCREPPMKRLRRSLIVLVAVATLSCGRGEPAARPVAVLSRVLDGDPATLDPTTTNEEAGLLVEALIYRPLLGLDAERRLVPDLATTWTVSPNGLVYEFRLDPNAKWDDGKPVTSDDVRFTLERIRDPKVPALNWRWGFEDLAAIETPDPGTVRVRFTRTYSERLLAFNLPIVSAAAFARARAPAETDRHPVGSGPYRLESWEANQTIRLARRADAPAQPGAFGQVVFRVLPDSAVRFRAGSLGELDEFRVTRDQRRTAEASPDFLARNRILRVPQFLIVLVVWNCRNPFLADARVRRALSLSWPREEAARRLYPPDGASLISGPYPPGVPENAPEIRPPAYDPASSARLLEEAGWKAGPDGVRRRDGRKASIELLFQAGQISLANLGEILRSSYEKVGVELVLRPLDWAAFSQRADAGEFDGQLTARLFLPPNLDPYPYFQSGETPPRGQNTGFYRNAEADRLLEAERRELDDGKRLELYRRIHRLLAADPPADFLWSADQYWAVSRRLEGVQVSPLGLFHFLPGPLGWRLAPAASP